jgi:hypothetical protein
MGNKANVAMQAVNLSTANGLTMRKENILKLKRTRWPSLGVLGISGELLNLEADLMD